MEDFKWTDSLVKEFEIFYNKIPYAITGIDPIKKGIEMFKNSKAKEEMEKFFKTGMLPPKKSQEPKWYTRGLDFYCTPSKEEPKEYEILSFKHNDLSYTKLHDQFYHRTHGKYCNTSLNHVPQNAEILSVKRFSDGEIFTVGDRINFESKPVTYTINKFVLSDSHLMTSVIGTQTLFHISLLKKAKEVLFTTEDGVPVYLDQRVWWVRKHDFELDFHDFYNGQSWFPDRFKYFSTKEAAEDWLILNKPCLSVNDIIKQPCGYTIDLPNILKELTKSKL